MLQPLQRWSGFGWMVWLAVNGTAPVPFEVHVLQAGD
jgi:hypothetical protein